MSWPWLNVPCKWWVDVRAAPRVSRAFCGLLVSLTIVSSHKLEGLSKIDNHVLHSCVANHLSQNITQRNLSHNSPFFQQPAPMALIPIELLYNCPDRIFQTDTHDLTLILPRTTSGSLDTLRNVQSRAQTAPPDASSTFTECAAVLIV